jgi:hypothetical protein
MMWLIAEMGEERKRTVRVSVPVSLAVLARVETLANSSDGEPLDKGELLARAIELGLTELENEPEVPRGERAMVYQREGHLSFGSRRESDDRRHGLREAQVGRRETDRTRSRKAFVEQVLDLVDDGLEYAQIAERLNEHGVTTSRGQAWSGTAIGQVVRTEQAKRRRSAWRPKSLK